MDSPTLVAVHRLSFISQMISVTLLLYPGFGLALSECKQWRSSYTHSHIHNYIAYMYILRGSNRYNVMGDSGTLNKGKFAYQRAFKNQSGKK